MPELPEVETIRQELNQVLPGRTIRKVKVFRADALGGVPSAKFRGALEGATFAHVSRRGKYLLFDLKPEGCLVGHLRMSGKFVVCPPQPVPDPYHRVWFELDDGELLVFQDVRCLGTLAAVPRPAAYEPLRALGLDPLSEEFTPAWLADKLAKSRTPVKHWLMDQSHIAGLGNIYVSEILFAAKLSPTLRCNLLKKPEVARLYKETRRVLEAAIRKSGTTIRDFRRVDEKTGEFQNFLQVYGKAGRPCPRCRTPIVRIVQQQRSTFYCPHCQS